MIVKKNTKCIICGKQIKKGEDCELSSGRGYTCNKCEEDINNTISSVIDSAFPEDEYICPYCNGTGRVNRMKARYI